MKKLLITRIIPDANIAFARARFDVTLRETAVGLTPDEAAEALTQYDAILPTLGDQFSAAAFDKAAGRIRCGVLANDQNEVEKGLSYRGSNYMLRVGEIELNCPRFLQTLFFERMEQ